QQPPSEQEQPQEQQENDATQNEGQQQTDAGTDAPTGNTPTTPDPGTTVCTDSSCTIPRRRPTKRQGRAEHTPKSPWGRSWGEGSHRF
ncbi:MAG: hypothetical protein KDD69_18660, partial [Bdellovibrionales bacterium]|nr:hypothetical protein [Bdellovibrionales bacterium]